MCYFLSLFFLNFQYLCGYFLNDSSALVVIQDHFFFHIDTPRVQPSMISLMITDYLVNGIIVKQEQY